MATRENVVISGIAGSFPNCEGLEEFKEALYERANLITDLTTEWTGKCINILSVLKFLYVISVPMVVGLARDWTLFPDFYPIVKIYCGHGI